MAKRVRNGDVDIAYEVHGTGQPLVLLHGYTARASEWHNQVGAFDRQIVAIDLRGHGDSSATHRSHYSFGELASDVVAVIDALELERVDLLGHSLGGMVACQLLAKHATRLRSVVFADTSPLPPDATRLATLQKQIAELEAGQGEMVDMAGRVVAREAAIGCAVAQRDMGSYADALRGNPIPALVLYGVDDSANVRNGSANLLELLPNSREAAIAGAGHVPQHTHAAEFNSAIQAFLEGSG